MYDSIIVLGATATGKTEFSIELAKRLNAEIINADSMYIYKYFNIGTAKPTQEEMNGIKHYLIDYIYPKNDYSVSQYRQDAKKIIEDLKLKNILPIIVGGTGFYIDSLIKDFSYGNSQRDDKLRKELEDELSNFGVDFLYKKLKKLDPLSASKIHPNDTKRVIRAIEICLASHTKKSKSKNTADIILTNPLIIGLTLPRDFLYEKINKRVDIMIKNGLIEEVKKLRDRGFYTNNCNAMKGIGYKELLDYFDGKMTIEESIELIKQHSRNYAKRQITWFKRNENIIWIDPREKDCISNVLTIFNNNNKKTKES